MCFRDWEDGYKQKQQVYNEWRTNKMSLKEWKNKELFGLLSEKWGFGKNVVTEGNEITHMCALKVTHKESGQIGHPIKHTLTESGDISHYTVEFDKVIVENIAVENLDIMVQEEHSHKRDDEKPHDKKKPVVMEDELEEAAKPDFLDLDKDGDKEEPMKDAAKDAKKGKEDEDEKEKLDEEQLDEDEVEESVRGYRKENEPQHASQGENRVADRLRESIYDRFRKLIK
jgi:hypothetical protein